MPKDIGTVYSILSDKDTIIFQGSGNIIKYVDEKVIVINGLANIQKVYFVNGNKYVRDRSRGLLNLGDTSVFPIRGGEIFKDKGIANIFSYDEKRELFATNKCGFYLYDGKKFKELKNDASKYAKENILLHGIKLKNGLYLFSTRYDGAFIMNDNFKLVDFFNAPYSLKDNNVKYAFQDRENNLWFALNNGLAYSEYSSPIKEYGSEFGLKGIVLSIYNDNNKLYVGTTDGLFTLDIKKKQIPKKLHKPIFKKEKEFKTIVWQIKKWNNDLLLGTSEGLFLGRAGKWRKIFGEKVFSIDFNKKSHTSIFVASYQGIFTIRKKSTNSYSIEKLCSTSARGLLVDNDTIWASSYAGKLFRLIIKEDNREWEISEYDSLKNHIAGHVSLLKTKEKILFGTKKGIFYFNDKEKMFYPDSTFGKCFADGSKGVFRLTENSKGDVFIHSDNHNYLAENKGDGQYQLDSKLFKRMEVGQINIIYAGPEYVWFGGNENIYRYDARKTKSFVKNFRTTIRYVSVGNDSMLYAGSCKYKSTAGCSPVLPYDRRDIRFQFAAQYFEASEEIEYQYLLRGYDQEWSEWTKETKKDYTNLYEGEYTFFVRARNIYGDVSLNDCYSFEVLPPFYRTWYAYATYFLGVCFIFYMLLRLRSCKLEERTLVLENEVAKRTKELKEKNERIERLDNIRSRFFANISHEFRTPLTLIIGPLEQMLEEESQEEKRKNIDMILHNSRRLLALINQLLDVARIENGYIKANKETTNLVALIENTIASFMIYAEQNNIALSFNKELKRLEAFIDYEKIEKVVYNIIGNALKFTNSGGKVDVSIKVDERDRGIITIEDTGIGISEANLKMIFKRFYRARVDEYRKNEGSGMGLAIAKEYVELHNGIIKVESIEGKGSKFIISLPLEKDKVNREEVVEKEREEGIKGNELQNVVSQEKHEMTEVIKNIKGEENEKQVLLIVEDNADIRDYLRNYFGKKYHVLEAEDGKVGIKLAKESTPDVIVSDIMMPNVSGYELCDELKADMRTSHIPIVLLTSKAGNENMLAGYKTGADDYITKPFNINLMDVRISNLLELRNQIKEKFTREVMLQPSTLNVSSIDEEFINRLHDLIETNLDNPDLNVEDLQREFAMGRSNLFRKINAITGQPPVQYIRSYRLKKAAQMIKAGEGNITEIAYAVGFSSSAYFTKCFKAQFNQLPSEYQVVES